jgi:uncharacterized protein YijF (DUF1287 family)/uncharacterized protein YgiM (DUF1202 family)
MRVRFAIVMGLLCAAAPAARADHYTLRGGLPLRQGPGPGARVLATLDANETVRLLGTQGRLAHVRVGADLEGFVDGDAITDVWVKALKDERALFLMKGDQVLARYRMALGAQDPRSDKQRRGDGATPEGRFYIAEADEHPLASRYGARSLRLSYPGAEDARRGLAAGLIDYATYAGIVRDNKAGRVPNQNTALGGSIRIHGGGSARDWTLGCLALDDDDVRALYARIGKGTRVDVYRSAARAEAMGLPGFLGGELLRGARSQLQQPALYTRHAMGALPLVYPGGDIDAHEAVCADIVVRAGRQAGLDLQALVHEDRLAHPELYDRRDGGPSHQIDHRRVRNLARFLARHATRPTANPALARADAFQPGDIVMFETGIANGTLFDHVGIVDDRRDPDGFPRVINIWTVGEQTSSMRLLGVGYPIATAHFRLLYPLDY